VPLVSQKVRHYSTRILMDNCLVSRPILKRIFVALILTCARIACGWFPLCG